MDCRMNVLHEIRVCENGAIRVDRAEPSACIRDRAWVVSQARYATPVRMIVTEGADGVDVTTVYVAPHVTPLARRARRKGFPRRRIRVPHPGSALRAGRE